jgi:predicted peptidase
MHRQAAIAFCLSIAALTAVHAAWAEDSPQKTAAPQSAKVLDRDLKVHLNYLLYEPKNYDAKPNWPLVLFLHGAGERGSDLNLVKKHGPPKLVEQGKDFPFVLVSPQCPAERWWESVSLSVLLDEIVEKEKIDKDRIYITGLSMGGFGTWSLAAYSPERFAAIVPICGGGEPFTVHLLSQLPVWAFHGGKDPIVPIARSEAMINGLKAAGGNVKFTIYPNASHDCWTETYDNPAVYDWLLKQKRPGQAMQK